MIAELMCPACGNPSRDGGLCDADERTLAAVLRSAPALLDELLIQTARLNVSSISGGKTSDRPLPINMRASELAAGYENLLVSWARACGGDEDETLVGGGREAARWLAERIYEVRVHEASGEIVDELRGHAKACLRAIDRHGADSIWIGNCTAEPPDEKECRTELRVPKGQKTMRCPRCEEHYDVAELLAARDAIIDERIYSTSEIAKLEFRLPDGRVIGLRMIEGYVTRKRLLPAGYRRDALRKKDVALYRIGDVKKAASDALMGIGIGDRDGMRKSA